MMSLVIVFLSIWCAGEAVILNRRCDETITAEPNFNPALYSGRWYELLRYETPNEFNIQCVTAEYTLETNGDIHAQNIGVNQNVAVESNATLLKTDPSSTDGKWGVKYSSTSNPLPYWVLGTDYNTYTVVYSCRNLPTVFQSSSVTSWVLTRTPALSGAVIAEVDKIIKRANLKWNLYKPTLHTAEACEIL